MQLSIVAALKGTIRSHIHQKLAYQLNSGPSVHEKLDCCCFGSSYFTQQHRALRLSLGGRAGGGGLGGGSERPRGSRAEELGGHRSVEKGRAGETTPSGRIWCRNWKVRWMAGGGDLTSQDMLVVFRRRVPSL